MLIVLKSFYSCKQYAYVFRIISACIVRLPLWGPIRHMSPFSITSSPMDDPGRYGYLQTSLSTLSNSEPVSGVEIAIVSSRNLNHRDSVELIWDIARSYSRLLTQVLSCWAWRVKSVDSHNAQDHPQATIWSRAATYGAWVKLLVLLVLQKQLNKNRDRQRDLHYSKLALRTSQTPSSTTLKSSRWSVDLINFSIGLTIMILQVSAHKYTRMANTEIGSNHKWLNQTDEWRS